MATREALRLAVQNTVADPSIDAYYIDLLLNEALDAVAAAVLLPELETMATVTTATDATSVALPDDFHRGLYGCSIAEQTPQPEVLSSMALMQKRYPAIESDTETGAVQHVCRRGGSLVYHPVPETATTIVLRYYRGPTAMTVDTDTPSEIPPHLQRELLCGYACAVIYDDIEDGIEGQKVNTQRHVSRFNEALARLEAYVKQSQSRPAPGRRGVNKWA